MADKYFIDPSLLRQLLSYNPETGSLTWLLRPDTFTYTSERGRKIFNSNYAGKPAMTAKDKSGRHSGAIFNRNYLAHRLIWAMVTGSWPSEEIDHINGDPSDNRFVNLRSVTSQENQRNVKRLVTNTSGITGVIHEPKFNRYRAFIGAGGKHVHIGCFANLNDAVDARKAAEKQLGFHPNHGQR